jgi:hypothetical protein
VTKVTFERIPIDSWFWSAPGYPGLLSLKKFPFCLK